MMSDVKPIVEGMTGVERDRLYALAILAFGNPWENSEQEHCYPEDVAIKAVDLQDENRPHVESGSAFGIAYRLGLEVGASIVRDPMNTPNLESIVRALRKEMHEAVSDGKRSPGVILGRTL
jgi:hypothetical protein